MESGSPARGSLHKSRPWGGRGSGSGVVFHPVRRLERTGFRSYALSKACGHWGFCPLCTRCGFLLVPVVRPGDTSVAHVPEAQRTVGSGLRWRGEAERGNPSPASKTDRHVVLPRAALPCATWGGRKLSEGACGAPGTGPRTSRSPQQPFETGIALSLCRAGIAICVFWL